MEKRDAVPDAGVDEPCSPVSEVDSVHLVLSREPQKVLGRGLGMVDGNAHFLRISVDDSIISGRDDSEAPFAVYDRIEIDAAPIPENLSFGT